MLVTDLHHFLELPEDTPGPARRLAEHLSNIVRAATAGDAATAWTTARTAVPATPRHPGLPRANERAAHRARTPIRWQCTVCDDEGVISNWEDSPFDLRRPGLALADAVTEIAISDDVAAALRDLQLLDSDRERLVFRIRTHRDRAVLTATDDDLEELIGFVAAEANHEPNRRRQRRLDSAADALNSAAQTSHRW